MSGETAQELPLALCTKRPNLTGAPGPPGGSTTAASKRSEQGAVKTEWAPGL